MVEQALRFAVGDGRTRRPLVWKCWNQGSGKSDVFLAARNLGQAFKTSLHEEGVLPHQTGEWHVGFDRSYLARNDGFPSEQWRDRFIAKWERPAELAPGVTLAYRIVTPAASTNLPVIPAVVGKGPITWYPAPERPLRVEMCVFLTAPGTPVTGWPAMRSMDTSLLGKFELSNGETVWIVARTCEMPRLKVSTAGPGKWLGGSTESDLDGPGLRAIFFGAEPDGSRVIYDVALASVERQPSEALSL